MKNVLKISLVFFIAATLPPSLGAMEQKITALQNLNGQIVAKVAGQKNLMSGNNIVKLQKNNGEIVALVNQQKKLQKQIELQDVLDNLPFHNENPDNQKLKEAINTSKFSDIWHNYTFLLYGHSQYIESPAQITTTLINAVQAAFDAPDFFTFLTAKFDHPVHKENKDFTPLIWATSLKENANAMVETLIAAATKANLNQKEFFDFINAKDHKGWAPLVWAAYNNNNTMVETLITAAHKKLSTEQFSEFINAKTGLGMTPLHYAVMQQNETLTETLINAATTAKLNPEQFSKFINTQCQESEHKGWTPLIRAVTLSDHQKALTLTQRLINAATTAKLNPTQFFEFINAQCQDNYHKGWTPLIWAANQNNQVNALTLTQILINAATTVKLTPEQFFEFINAKNKVALNLGPKDIEYDWTPLHYAVKNFNEKLIETLIAAATTAKRNPTQFFDFINAKTRDGRTPLIMAASQFDNMIIQILITAAVNGKLTNEQFFTFINAKDDKDMTPLHYAATFINTDLAQSLITAAVNAKFTQEQFFDFINAKNRNSWTTLIWAASLEDKVNALNLIQILITVAHEKLTQKQFLQFINAKKQASFLNYPQEKQAQIERNIATVNQNYQDSVRQKK